MWQQRCALSLQYCSNLSHTVSDWLSCIFSDSGTGLPGFWFSSINSTSWFTGVPMMPLYATLFCRQRWLFRKRSTSRSILWRLKIMESNCAWPLSTLPDSVTWWMLLSGMKDERLLWFLCLAVLDYPVCWLMVPGILLTWLLQRSRCVFKN